MVCFEDSSNEQVIIIPVSQGSTLNISSVQNSKCEAPASTAGVERVFSAAGRMHSHLRKSMKDSTLEHSLMAAFNTD